MVAKRVRNFAFIIYENLKLEYWKRKLSEIHIPGYCVLHDKDAKKPHMHVLMTPEGGRSIDSIKLILGCLGVKSDAFEEVKSLRSYARYLCHLDNPEKHRYNMKEVISFCGTNYEEYINENRSVGKAMEIIEYCKENSICRFCDLVEYSLKNNEEWFEYLISGYKSRLIIEYLKSKQWSERK